MKFEYKRYTKDVLRPVIPVQLQCKNRFINYEALVDSGADFCIFDAQIGELLNIDIKSGEKQMVSGITGAQESYYIHPITMIVGGWSNNVKVGFLPNIARLGYGVVGQKGFFDIFVVKFDLLKGEIEVKQRDDKKGAT